MNLLAIEIHYTKDMRFLIFEIHIWLERESLPKSMPSLFLILGGWPCATHECRANWFQYEWSICKK